MNRRLVSVLVIGALVIGATAWMTYPRRPKSITDLAKARYMHCPECSREKKYSPAPLDEKCLVCDKPMIVTAESITRSGTAENPYGRMLMLMFAELVGVLAAVWFITRPRHHNPDEELIYMKCEQCRQKIRYREPQIGNAAMCPRCKHPFVYPEIDPDA